MGELVLSGPTATINEMVSCPVEGGPQADVDHPPLHRVSPLEEAPRHGNGVEIDLAIMGEGNTNGASPLFGIANANRDFGGNNIASPFLGTANAEGEHGISSFWIWK